MLNPNLSSENNAFLLPFLEQKVKPLVLGATARYFGSSGLIGTAAISGTEIHYFMDRRNIFDGRRKVLLDNKHRKQAFCGNVPKIAENVPKIL